MKRVVIYARVSSTNGTQDYQRQINDLTAFARQNNFEIAKAFAEQVSGTKKNSERPVLMEMIEFVNTNNIDKVLVTELSRLGRDTLQTLQTIELLNQNKISLHIQNYNIETLSPNGDINPMSQFLITILAEVARMERKTIRERVESGYKNHLANGGSVGRKVGYRKDNEAMKSQYTEDIKLLKKGYSLRNIQKITGTSVNTLRKVKAIA
ncbi:DNA invertase Pin-like site-specific DNA recombinase [Dysgonomonas sp. PFB1-18]|uniref:recombinase family protein n=1 Tax=unclassified Dysgonomonas TaxID=2630389 RepID=UPI002473E1C4|nr:MULTISPECIES: recombinase family protein [unclassified Dysgonomonas]MDH6311177.1 DNA invertase Pin-like site-specific DNA recombinase [Dysgonomonas sp. PF1-14]MDH6341061.1 DNA invertase Pin-like site-specific DNA recombinase [Dysgonomonas sp. PF1-16]MDH6382758.1 DNA invertase Pin-like site-specific DNA recombinase [Dysgonomonas sp. PFB1-18]MDH6400049.1 DNA invertase Pin-like site-specific DNA recombinase [Dysgonomonas sp. PF1-23]